MAVPEYQVEAVLEDEFSSVAEIEEDFEIEHQIDIIVNSNPTPLDMPQPSIKQTYIAGEPISSGNVIMINNNLAFKYDPSNVNNYGKAIGIAIEAVLTSSPVIIVLSGEIYISGWGLSQDAYYFAGSAGSLATTASSSGLLNTIGIAKDSNTLIIDIDEPTIL